MVGSCVLKNKSVRPRRHIIGSDKRYNLIHRCKKLDEIHYLIWVSQDILLRAEEKLAKGHKTKKRKILFFN